MSKFHNIVGKGRDAAADLCKALSDKAFRPGGRAEVAVGHVGKYEHPVCELFAAAENVVAASRA